MMLYDICLPDPPSTPSPAQISALKEASERRKAALKELEARVQMLQAAYGKEKEALV